MKTEKSNFFFDFFLEFGICIFSAYPPIGKDYAFDQCRRILKIGILLPQRQPVDVLLKMTAYIGIVNFIAWKQQ